MTDITYIFSNTNECANPTGILQKLACSQYNTAIIIGLTIILIALLVCMFLVIKSTKKPKLTEIAGL